MLIAHFVGDLHQPLHVGAVYLHANGVVVDPDAVGLDIGATLEQTTEQGHFAEAGELLVTEACEKSGFGLVLSRSDNSR